MFEALVTPITMKELIAQGFLVPYQLIRPGRQLRNDEIAKSPVDAWQAHAAGRKTIVFAAHNKAAAEFADQFNAAGVPADRVYDEQTMGERVEVLRRFKTGALTVLINVAVLTEGFDDRAVSCVILACSIGPKAVSRYLQCVGRGLRRDDGKTDCIIIDLPGNSYTHGAPDDDREWSLEGDGIKKKPVPVPEKFCAVCGVLIDAGANVCLECGIARPELVSPTVVNEKLVPYAAKRREDPDKRARTLAYWLDEADRKGHKPGAVMHKFKAVYGEWPPGEIATLAAKYRKPRPPQP